MNIHEEKGLSAYAISTELLCADPLIFCAFTLYLACYVLCNKLVFFIFTLVFGDNFLYSPALKRVGEGYTEFCFSVIP